MDLAQASPAHICTIVPPNPNLPHYHGTLDAAAVRAGGEGGMAAMHRAHSSNRLVPQVAR
jgi:hypothetical protein